MGGEGSMLAAMASLKANRALRNKRKKDEFSLVSSKDEKWEDPIKATPEQLAEIRTRIRKEEKVRRMKILIITVVLFIAILGGFLYILN